MSGLSAWLGWGFHVTGGLVVIGGALLSLRRRRLVTEGMLAVLCGAVAGGMLGALLLHAAASRLARPAAEPAVAALVGRTWIGALVGGWIGVEGVKRRLGLRRSTGDFFAPWLPLGEAIGRVGCHFGGCCFGAAASVPWAVHQHGAWRHPAQLYAVGIALALFAILWRLRDRLPREGDLFRVYLLLYAIGRFTLEFFRDHGPSSALLSTAQWTCIAGVAYLLATWWPGFHRALQGSRPPLRVQ